MTYYPWDDEDKDPAEVYKRTWQPVDIAPILDGQWTPPTPSVGSRGDGVGLFYPGKAHTVASESEAGKTWFALSAVIDEIGAGKNVIYIDFEDDAGPMVTRLLTLGLAAESLRQHFHYIRPEGPVGSGINLDDLNQLCEAARPTLGILDGITEAMTLHGLDPLDNADAAKFGRMLPRHIAQRGAACVSLDHVTKNGETRGRYSIGAVHKLNALDGAAYVLENRDPFGIGLTGRSTIRIAKDRPGQLRRHALPGAGGMHWFGDLVLTSHSETYGELEVQPPHERDPHWRPTALMQAIADAISARGPLSQRRLRIAVQGKNESISTALEFLILDGFVSEKTPHDLLKPYLGGRP
jgi:hypothetical protein